MTGHVLGLDLGLAAAGAARFHHDGRFEAWQLQTPPQPGATLAQRAARIRRVTRWAVDQVATTTVLVVLEAPSYGSEHGQAHERGAVWWWVVDALTRAEVPLATLAPRTLKKRITGHGDADKRQMRAALAAELPGHGIERLSYDQVDAGGLAVCGADWLAWPSCPPLGGRRGTPWPRTVAWPARESV